MCDKIVHFNFLFEKCQLILLLAIFGAVIDINFKRPSPTFLTKMKNDASRKQFVYVFVRSIIVNQLFYCGVGVVFPNLLLPNRNRSGAMGKENLALRVSHLLT